MQTENVQAEQGHTETAEQVEQTEVSIEDKFYPDEEKQKEQVKEPAEEESKEEESPEAEEKKAPDGEKKAPEKYALKVPKESHLDKSAIERIEQYAKERGLSNDEAQWLLDREHQAVDGYVKRATELNQRISKEWAEQVKQDKEIGGEKYDQAVAYARNAMQRFASEELIKALQETGYGNHPELVRTFYRIGRAMSNDRFVTPREHGSTQKKSMEDLFYSTNKE